MISETEWSISAAVRGVALFLLVLAASICSFAASAQEIDSAKVAKAVGEQLNRYPESTLCDIYKSFFQDEYGPGHLIADSATAAGRLQEEIDRMTESRCPLYEITGSSGNFYRVSLETITKGYVSFEVFLSAFLRSASLAGQPKVEDWQKRWNEIERLISPYTEKIHDYGQCKETIARMLSQNRYVMGHSERYNRSYQPHYRLIHRSIFEKDLLPLIKPHLRSQK